MNYLKKTTVGIDTEIKRLQTGIYNGLIAKWCLEDFDAYGRVYKNRKEDKILPEYYSGESEYKEVLLDDSKDGIMFFVPSDTARAKGSVTNQDCDIIFSFNLNALGSNDERQDEELRSEVIGLITKYNKEEKQIITGLQNVYRDFNGVADFFWDMQEFHHFKVTVELNFNNRNCIN